MEIQNTVSNRNQDSRPFLPTSKGWLDKKEPDVEAKKRGPEAPPTATDQTAATVADENSGWILFKEDEFEAKIKSIIQATHEQLKSKQTLQTEMEEHVSQEFIAAFARQFATNFSAHFYTELSKQFFFYLQRAYGQQNQPNQNQKN
jgi:hypothetical protein